MNQRDDDEIEKGYCARRRWMWENNETELHMQPAPGTPLRQKSITEILRSYVEEGVPIKQMAHNLTWTEKKVIKELQYLKLAERFENKFQNKSVKPQSIIRNPKGKAITEIISDIQILRGYISKGHTISELSNIMELPEEKIIEAIRDLVDA